MLNSHTNNAHNLSENDQISCVCLSIFNCCVHVNAIFLYGRGRFYFAQSSIENAFFFLTRNSLTERITHESVSYCTKAAYVFNLCFVISISVRYNAAHFPRPFSHSDRMLFHTYDTSGVVEKRRLCVYGGIERARWRNEKDSW